MDTKTKIRVVTEFCASVCASALVVMPVAANADAASPVAATTTDNGPQLQDIVVTARRTNESQQKVPVAITSFSGDDVRKQNIFAPQDLMTKVPSLSITANGQNRDSLRISIRGQGQSPNGSEGSVLSYFAEVPVTLTGPGSLFDLESLQVLKGPQGTLFGRNSTGGALLVEPKRPGNDWNGYADFSIGSDSLRRGQAAINVPIIKDVLSVRFAADINRRQGFTQDVVSGVRLDDVHYDSYRVGIQFKPADWVENYLVLDSFKSDTNGTGAKLFSLDPNGYAATGFGALSTALVNFYNLHLPWHQTAIYTGGTPYDQVRNRGLENITTFHLSNGIYIKNVFGLREYKQHYDADVLGAPIPLVDFIPSPYNASGESGSPSAITTSEELQMGGTSFDARLKWVAGLYGDNERPTSDLNKEVLTQFGSPPYVLQQLDRNKTRAVFTQETYSLTDQLKFTAGLRYTWDTRAQKSRTYFANAADLNTPVTCLLPLADNQTDCQVSAAGKYKALTGTVGVDYQVTPKTLIYLASRRGYKSGGFNSNTPDATFLRFAPEYVTDVELGMKSDVHIDHIKVRINADVYRQYYNNIQQSFGKFIPGNGLVALTQNSGKGIYQGFELEYTVIPSRFIEFSGYYNYLDAHYTQNTILGVDLRHIAIAQAPKNKFAITASVNLADLPPSAGKVSASVTYAYQSRVEFQVPDLLVDPDPNHGQAGYGLVNVRADWENVLGSDFDTYFFMSNVTDKDYKISGTAVYQSLGIDGGLTGEPREFGFGIRYHF